MLGLSDVLCLVSLFVASFPSKRWYHLKSLWAERRSNDNCSRNLGRPSQQQQSRLAFLITAASIPFASEAKPSMMNMAPTTKDESLSGFVAGAALSATKTLVKYPLDTATVRLQTSGSKYRRENIASLFEDCYNGVSLPLLSNIPAGAVFFSVKDATKASMSSWEMERWMKTCIAVAAAQIPYWWVRNPSEVAKTRQQAGVDGYQSVSAAQSFQQVRQDATSGNADDLAALKEFYTGYWENIFYAYPADVLKFICYDQLTGGGRKDLSPQEGAVAGALATAVAQFVTTPLDVVRNRIMANVNDKDKKMSYIESLVNVAKVEGLAGVFAGVTPRIGKAAISGAIQFATYEETKQKMANLLQRRVEGRSNI